MGADSVRYMNEVTYASSDDFPRAAAAIYLVAAHTLKDADQAIANAGFFRRRRIRKVWEPTFAFLHLILDYVQESGGVDAIKDLEWAKRFCRKIPRVMRDPDFNKLGPDQARVMHKSLAMMASKTAGHLTKSTHDTVWYGSSQMAADIDAIVQGRFT